MKIYIILIEDSNGENSYVDEVFIGKDNAVEYIMKLHYGEDIMDNLKHDKEDYDEEYAESLRKDIQILEEDMILFNNAGRYEIYERELMMEVFDDI